MASRTPILLIIDIIDSGNKILLCINNLSFNTLINDSKTVGAVLQHFEITGEAAN